MNASFFPWFGRLSRPEDGEYEIISLVQSSLRSCKLGTLVDLPQVREGLSGVHWQQEKQGMFSSRMCGQSISQGRRNARGKVEGFFCWGRWFLPGHPFPPRGEAGRSGLIPVGALRD